MHFGLSGAGRVVDAMGWVELAIYTLDGSVDVLWPACAGGAGVSRGEVVSRADRALEGGGGT